MIPLSFILTLVVCVACTVVAQEEETFKCSDNSMVRLLGGSRQGEGRLELNTGNGWGSVCPNRGWSATTAGILCTELCGTNKYSSSVPATARFGALSSPFMYSNLKCKGFENSFSNCAYADVSTTNRSIYCEEDTGVGLCCHSGCNNRNMFLAPRPKYYLTCGFDAYTVFVNSVPGSLNEAVYPFNLQPMTNASCDSAETNQNETHVWLKVPYLGDCGISPSNVTGEYNGYVKYRQSVKIGVQVSDVAVTRLTNYILDVSCGVNKETKQTIHMDSSKPEGILEDRVEAGDELSTDMAIKVFDDVNYKKELVTPVKLPVGTPIFIQLEVDPSKVSPGTKLIGIRCTAMPFSRASANLQHVIIDGAEAIDESVLILKAVPLHTMQFRLQTFKIGINYKEVYLTCSAVICPVGDKSENCVSDEAMAQHKNNNVRRSKFRSEAASDRRKVASVQTGAVGIEEPVFTDKIEKIVGSKNVIRTGIDGIKYLVMNPGKKNQIVRLLPKEESE